MKTELHDKLVDKVKKRLESQNLRVIEFNEKINPDLVAISKNGDVTAIEVETRSAGVHKKRKQIKKYSEFDKVRIYHANIDKRLRISYKAKRYYPKKFFERVEELTKEGCSQAQICKTLEIEFKRPIPQSTVSMIQNGRRKWNKNRIQTSKQSRKSKRRTEIALNDKIRLYSIRIDAKTEKRLK